VPLWTWLVFGLLGARIHRAHRYGGRAGFNRPRLPLILGLEMKDMAMLALTFLVSAVTLGTGRT
jgi:hypothetical protein